MFGFVSKKEYEDLMLKYLQLLEDSKQLLAKQAQLSEEFNRCKMKNEELFTKLAQIEQIVKK